MAHKPYIGDTDARDYVVRASGESRGRLLSVDGDPSAAGVGERCFERFFAASEHCHGCPVFDESPRAERWAVVKHCARGHFLELVRVKPVGARALSVRTQHIDDAITRAIVRTKLDCICDDARLTERERQILRLLLVGEDSSQVAKRLSISDRTVRFHQTNLMRKLGVDARSELTRLFF